MFLLITLLPIFILTEVGNADRLIRSEPISNSTSPPEATSSEPVEITNSTDANFYNEPEIVAESEDSVELRISPVPQQLRKRVQYYYVVVEIMMPNEETKPESSESEAKNGEIVEKNGEGAKFTNYSLSYHESVELGLLHYAAFKLLPDQLNETSTVTIGSHGNGPQSKDSNYLNPPLKNNRQYRFGLAVLLDDNSFRFYPSQPAILKSKELDLIKSLIALFIGLIIILLVVIAGLIYYLRQSEVDIRWQDVVMIWSKRSRSSLFKDKNRPYKRCTDRLTVSKNCKSATYFSGSNYINMEVEHNIIDIPTLITNLSDPKYLSTLQTEFDGIPFIQMPSKVGNKPENRKKNRYIYLNAYDFNRVKLLLDDDEDGEETGQSEAEKEEGSPNLKPTDYINASYIDGYNALKSYIATQGPLPWTFNDFWKMIWQQECSQIVMLTGIFENGRIKCDQYWPENEEITYGKIKVKHLSTNSESPDFVTRRFIMTKDNESREVVHYHNINWPDHGAPTSPKALIDLIETIESDGKQLEYKGPLVVHCSAGVGRTGTYIMVDIMMKMGLAENKVDILGQLYLLRKQRTHMIETEDQYCFTHQALVWYFKEKDDNTKTNKQSSENEILINVDDNDKRAVEP